MRPQIESGEYQVVMRDSDKPVRIICWDADPKYPVCYLEKTASQTLPVMVGPNGSFYEDPEDADEYESRADLFVLVPDNEHTKEESLSEHQTDLLIREIDSRIYHGLICCSLLTSDHIIVTGLDYDGPDGPSVVSDSNTYYPIQTVRPYLRSLSGMTNIEWAELDDAIIAAGGLGYNHHYNDATAIIYVDFMLEHHFDHRGLIDMGLAIKAPKEIYG